MQDLCNCAKTSKWYLSQITCGSPVGFGHQIQIGEHNGGGHILVWSRSHDLKIVETANAMTCRATLIPFRRLQGICAIQHGLILCLAFRKLWDCTKVGRIADHMGPLGKCQYNCMSDIIAENAGTYAAEMMPDLIGMKAFKPRVVKRISRMSSRQLLESIWISCCCGLLRTRVRLKPETSFLLCNTFGLITTTLYIETRHQQS